MDAALIRQMREALDAPDQPQSVQSSAQPAPQDQPDDSTAFDPALLIAMHDAALRVYSDETTDHG